jgi:hypothetical protein
MPGAIGFWQITGVFSGNPLISRTAESGSVLGFEREH